MRGLRKYTHFDGVFARELVSEGGCTPTASTHASSNVLDLPKRRQAIDGHLSGNGGLWSTWTPPSWFRLRCGLAAVVVMTGEIVASLALPKFGDDGSATRPGSLRRRMTLPQSPQQRLGGFVYDLSAVDTNGRVVAPASLLSLGWTPGTRLAMDETCSLIVVTSTKGGKRRVDARGHFRLPLGLRRWCDLDAGSQVLAVAKPSEQCLVLHPMASLDAVIEALYAEVLDGGGR